MADNGELKNLQARRAEQKALLDEALKGKTDEERLIVKQTASYKANLNVLREINEQVRQIKDANKAQVDDLISQEKALKGLTGLQASLVSFEREKIQKLAAMPGLNSDVRDSIQSISDLNHQLLQTSSEDVVTRGLLNKQLDDEFKSLQGKRGVHGQLAKLMEKERNVANGISQMTEKQQQFLEKQHATYNGIKDAIGGVLQTASLLTSTVGGVVGSLIVGLGYVAEAVGKTTRQMGGFVGGLTGATAQVTVLGTVFPQALESAKGLSSEFGGLKDVSFQTQLNTNLMATNMGISGQEAAALTGNFARLNGGSAEMGQNLAESTKELAKANGLMPSQVMADVAGSAQAFAEYGKQSGKNIGEAAVAAGKLGVNMSTLTGVTDSLLDFESSITKELELGAMLGRNINFNKARQLAYDGKIGASVKEALNQMGGIDAFNKMDIYQKRQAAQALGLSTEQLQKMASNMDKLNDDGTMQLSTFDSMSQSLTAFSTGPLGSTLKGLGSATIAAGQLNTGLGAMGGSIGGVVKGTGQVLKNLLGMVGGPVMKGLKGIGGSIANSGLGKKVGGFGSKLMAGVGKGAQAAAPAAGGGGISDRLNQTTSGGGRMNAGNMIKGAAAILILSAALWVAAKAFQEFGSVTWEAVAMGLVGLAGMATIAVVLGQVTGQLLQGALAVAALGVALIPFAFSMQMMGGIGLGQFASIALGLILISGAAALLGFALPFIASGALALGLLGAGLVVFGAGMMVAGKGLEMFVGSIATIAQIIPQILGMGGFLLPLGILIAGLASAFLILAASLAFLGTYGLPGLAVLAGIAAVGGMIVTIADYLGLGGDGGGETSTESTAVESDSLAEYHSNMLEKMDELKEAFLLNKDVYLDKDKVTNLVMAGSERVTKNTFGLGVG